MKTLKADPMPQARQAMEEVGLGNGGDIVPDGEIHRFYVEGDKPGSQNGWYVFFDDGICAGAFGSWKTGEKINWCQEQPSNLSQAERDEWTKKRHTAEAARDAALSQRRAEAAKRAKEIWDQAIPTGPHPYLETKQVRPHGLRFYKGLIVIPLRDHNGKIHSLQFIKPNGEKRLLKDGAMQGHFYLIGDHSGHIWIVEGYATGATVFEVMGGYVVVAFNAGNLLPVAHAMRQLYPDAHITIVADNDQWTDGNPGVSKAKAAAEAIRAKLVVPQFANFETEPTDFNDLHGLEGLDMVRQQLEGGAFGGNGDGSRSKDDTTEPPIDLDLPQLPVIPTDIFPGWVEDFGEE